MVGGRQDAPVWALLPARWADSAQARGADSLLRPFQGMSSALEALDARVCVELRVCPLGKPGARSSGTWGEHTSATGRDRPQVPLLV